MNYSIRDVHQHIRDIQAEKEALKVRCEVLGEPIDKEAVTELENPTSKRRRTAGEAGTRSPAAGRTGPVHGRLLEEVGADL